MASGSLHCVGEKHFRVFFPGFCPGLVRGIGEFVGIGMVELPF